MEDGRPAPDYLTRFHYGMSSAWFAARVRHPMGWASIKMYDQFRRILRIETTTKEAVK